jgi:LytR cell envelope-related transcriptional attenuator
MKRVEIAEAAALTLTLALVGAFTVSFVTGIHVRSGGPAASVAPPIVTPAVDPGRDPRGRVEVLNGSNSAGMARDVTERLRDAGFDVVYFGNADRMTDTSVVIDRMGRPDIAKAVAGQLGIGRITTAVDSSLYLDVTIILGGDRASKKQD